ncbi:hypothetical protein [Streptomyces ipomoeae]|uniref:hypothetical protein n=1 Tax=Streptomyces ipomoeae TaxID=103232 RepID=UPI0029BA4B55|nr:hypothetical protein [Streptomyces ipomoeae]MDX2700336.1 hypothetical protein [Streptomyces ipomoeae]MDX2845960.1 hypothetical protein [Streptomyces ipomoeae]
MNLIELALTTYTEYLGAAEDEADARAEELRDSFLAAARATAGTRLGSAADELEWTYTPHGTLPKDTEQATALLAPGRLEYLRYRYDHDAEDTSFELVQPCGACGHDRVNEVPGLTRLGELLHQDEQPHQDEKQDAEPGPLAATETLEALTARIAGLARRLITEHPGLTVADVHAFGHDDASSTGKIRIKAATFDALDQIAHALGVDVTNKTVDVGDGTLGGSGLYGRVFRHAHANAETDGIEIELRASAQLSVDEATAWRATQDRPADEEGTC